MRRRWAATILAAALVIAALVFWPSPAAGHHAPAGHARASHSRLVLVANDGTDPPQNVVFYILNPSGQKRWFDAIGMGADAAAGVKALVKFMISDGSTIITKGCGWRTFPCVLEWPGPS